MLGGASNKSSIEVWGDSYQRWRMMVQDQLIDRRCAGVTAINSDTIAVFGGRGQTDGYLFHTQMKFVERIAGSEQSLQFTTYSRVAQVGEQRFVLTGFVGDNVIKLELSIDGDAKTF